MCTYNFSFNDSLMECMRRAFPNEEAAREWLQRQMNGLIVDFVAKQEGNSERRSVSAKDLYGIWDNDGLTSDEAVNELRNLRTFKGCTLSQRLRSIATAPKNFDYKQELANRYEA